MAGATSHPNLAEFLGGWFHQDFDIAGPTVADVIAQFRAVSNTPERQAILRDIDAFLAVHPGPADDAFRAVFNPDVDPAGFGQSARDWLGEIRALLAMP